MLLFPDLKKKKTFICTLSSNLELNAKKNAVPEGQKVSSTCHSYKSPHATFNDHDLQAKTLLFYSSHIPVPVFF